MTGELAPGQKKSWNLIKKLGEGDAGEVFLVESLLEKEVAILKRSLRSAFASDIIRQASQIEREAKVLSALASLSSQAELPSTPRLLDQSKPGTEFSERFFIVISPALGFDLRTLARLVRFGFKDQISFPHIPSDQLTRSEVLFLSHLAEIGQFPRFVLLRALYSLVRFLSLIHTQKVNIQAAKYAGFLWNDVKPEHVFWEPQTATITLIDWGNAQFLENDGITQDRQFSCLDDYRQFIDEMGNFLVDVNPDLYDDLAWPQGPATLDFIDSEIRALEERIRHHLEQESNELLQARQQEAGLINTEFPSFEHFQLLTQVHHQIISHGEIPNYEGSEQFFIKLAENLIAQKDFTAFGSLCRQAEKNTRFPPEKWLVLEQLASLVTSGDASPNALQLGLQEDWSSALWELAISTVSEPPPSWLEELSHAIRNLEISSDTLPPLVALNRLIHALQASLQDFPEPSSGEISTLLHRLRSKILPAWSSLEPDPPDSDLTYRQIEQYFNQILQVSPIAGQSLMQALEKPRAQVKWVLDNWERQEFENARQGLRYILLWDPARRRLFQADRAIQLTPSWLEEVRAGPHEDEPLQDFVARIELEGRELRNQVGPASWLDAFLEVFSMIRKGKEPMEALLAYPFLSQDLSWLLNLESHHPVLSIGTAPITLERQPDPPIPLTDVRGIRKAALGEGKEIHLTDPLDNWVPEARGSSSRVFRGWLRGKGREKYQVAIKLMRPDRIDYALPLFRDEVTALTLLRDIPGITHLIECGFIHLSEGSFVPPEHENISAESLSGDIRRYSRDSIHNFLADMENQAKSGWLPYLALSLRHPQDNLLMKCDPGHTNGRFMPILEGLRIGIQICDLLSAVHARNIVYRDHKILHYYWQEANNGIFVIDWNISKRHPEGLPQSEVQFDLVQFGARVLHHILTGRTAPGALPSGPNLPEEIEAAASHYTIYWTYDDQRLPKTIKNLLERLLSGEYSDAKTLRQDLLEIFNNLSTLTYPNDFNSLPPHSELTRSN